MVMEHTWGTIYYWKIIFYLITMSQDLYTMSLIGTEHTPSPRIMRFPLARFPLTRILAYVRASGGILS